MIDWTSIDWADYNSRVESYIAQGMDHSDAEGIVDAEILQEQNGKKEVDSSRG